MFPSSCSWFIDLPPVKFLTQKEQAEKVASMGPHLVELMVRGPMAKSASWRISSPIIPFHPPAESVKKDYAP